MDGLVSTGKQISLHNIKNNFLYLKNFSNKFYSILSTFIFWAVEKAIKSWGVRANFAQIICYAISFSRFCSVVGRVPGC